MNLILFGYKNCGKTTIGKILSKRLNRLFLDTDTLAEQLYMSRTGEKKKTCDIYKKIGADAFRALESDVIQQLKATNNAVIALGGGLILTPGNAALLAKLGQLVYLRLDKETLKKRTLGRELPAFLDPSDPEGSFERIYKERKKIYEEICAFSVDLETKTQDQVVQEICTLIQKLESENG